MGAIVLNGARIGRGCLVGAGALVTEGKTFPEGSLIIGGPAKAMRELEPQDGGAEEVGGDLRRKRPALRRRISWNGRTIKRAARKGERAA